MYILQGKYHILLYFTLFFNRCVIPLAPRYSLAICVRQYFPVSSSHCFICFLFLFIYKIFIAVVYDVNEYLTGSYGGLNLKMAWLLLICQP